MGSSKQKGKEGSHSAVDTALGFYYQSLYGLLCIVKATDDNASVCLERLDDVEILANGQPLLAQLKHSLSDKPTPVTISSASLWKTLKAWIDVLPKLNITETRFQLVTVAPLAAESPLDPLLDPAASRDELCALLVAEAQRVVDEHAVAKASEKKPLPHAKRIECCAAFLKLSSDVRQKLFSRVTIQPGASNIADMPKDIAKELKNFPPDQRDAITQRLIEWWDLQIVHSFCGNRERVISVLEVQQQLSEIAGQLSRDELLADFLFVRPPDDHTPPSMIARQLQLVSCSKTEIQAAEMEEWRARSQRHKWINERVDMAVRINLYDQLLIEEWSVRHGAMAEHHQTSSEDTKRAAGLEIFKWSYQQASTQVTPFAKNWSASYYIRGSYQVLAVEQSVGWHPDFKTLLAEKP